MASGLDLASNHKCEVLVPCLAGFWPMGTACWCTACTRTSHGVGSLFGLTLSMFELRKSSVDRCGSSPILTVVLAEQHLNILGIIDA
ncbi:hypothetical protein KC320_g69 [Hortaea werneckii]|nr:hypothetical protein KC320_g69 [Hortaea werneckii]